MTGAPREVYAPNDFIIVSLAAVRALGGSWEAAGCFQRIAWRAERDGYWRATMKEIAAEIEVSERTAHRITTKLRDLGWITAEREDRWESTLTWRVNFADESADGNAKLAVPAAGEETAGQSTDGQVDSPEDANLAVSGSPNMAASADANLAASQPANEAVSSLQTVETIETTDDSLRSSSAPDADQPELVSVAGGASTTRATGTEKPEDLAERISQDWWNYFTEHHGPITRRGKSSPFVALRRNVIQPALDAGYTEAEIKHALLRTGDRDVPDPLPNVQQFQRTLAAVRNNVPAQGGSRATNVHQLPTNHPDQQSLVDAFNG